MCPQNNNWFHGFRSGGKRPQFPPLLGVTKTATQKAQNCLCVCSCPLLLEKGILSLLMRTGVQKKCCRNVYNIWCGFIVSEKRSSNPWCTHSTPHTNLNSIIFWHIVEQHGKSVILRVHISADLKPSFTFKQNTSEIWFIAIQPMVVPVHKILIFFTVLVSEFVFHSCLMWMQYERVFCTFSYLLECKLLLKNFAFIF
jgi:hypothetical protein